MEIYWAAVGAVDEDDGKNMQFIAIAKKYVNTMYISNSEM